MFGMFGGNSIPNLSGSEFQKAIDEKKGAVILDVRTEDEFMAGYIPTAINIDIYDEAFADKISKLDKSKIYLVYCRSGARSMSACKFMKDKGFEDVSNLNGGILGWRGDIKR